MPAQKISVFCTFVAASFFATSGQASLLNRAVFPNDETIPRSFGRHEFANSAEEPKDVTKHYSVCQTDGCKTVAKEFLSSMNKSVDPCENFYDYVCGGWTPENAIPPSLPSWSRFMMFQKVVNYRIKVILESEIEPTDILPVRQAKKWFRSCMDTETLEDRKMKPIESILLRAGGWPIAMDEEEWDADEHSWQDVADSYVHLTGSHVFYRMTASGPHGETDHGTIRIQPQDLPLHEHMPLKYRNYTGNDYKEYLNFVSDTALMFMEGSRADVSEEKLLKDAKAIVEFEKNVYELGKERTFTADMTWETFGEWYKDNMESDNETSEIMIDWQSLIQNQFNSVNIKVHPSTDLYMWSLKYLVGMNELLAKTPTRTIVNYIHWHFIANMLAYTTEDARNILYTLLMEEYGIKERPPRWSECVDDMKMAHASAYAFVNQYFSKDTVEQVKKMSKSIQNEMNEQIDAATWLDEEAKAMSKDKLNSMRIFIGFPDWYKDKKVVTKFYKGLNIGNEYFDNTLSYMRYEAKMVLKSYSSAPGSDDGAWFLDPITVNAIYGSEDNTLHVPAADFQAPLFTPGIPDNVNYGVAGVVVGHEIGHGFDESGILSGKDGNRTKLAVSVLKNFYHRAECFIDQFDKYYGETKPPEMPETTEDPAESRSPASVKRRKSQDTRAENMADSTGIQAVFQAYKKLKKQKESVRLVGMEDLTDDQLFFVSFAAMWCEIGTPQYEKKNAEIEDVHSPGRYRVLGGVSNTKGFADAFNCPAGSPMNPADKCSVWSKEMENIEMEPAWMRRRPSRWGGHWRG